ncbi:MAG: PD40 domain-containing protein [Bryobacteraceae bacterium]|nr:PD40 domain-containing protein [Bryobacteraceae bacterium]
MRQDNSESIVRRSVSDSPRVGAYGFGPFRLELAKRTLERDGSQVILPSRAFDALTVLIENRGQVVEKDVLMRLVWPTTNVEENNVAQCMVAIRRALGDHYVATVAGRGYSFTAPVRTFPEETAKGHSARYRSIFAGGLLVALMGAIVWQAPTPSGDKPRFVPLTGSNNEARPSFSPDGLRVVYDWIPDGERRRSLYIKLLGAGDAVRLTRSGFAANPAWSPDGRYIAYMGEPRVIYLVPSVGGAERRLTSTQLMGVGGRQISWSPDGKRLAFVDRDAETGWPSIFDLSVESGERRQLTRGVGEYGDLSPAVSPDGKTLAFIRVSSLAVYAIYLAPVAGGEPRRLTRFEERANGFAWTPDGRDIVFSGNPDGFRSLWRVSAAGGISRRIPAAGYDAFGPVVAPVGNRLAFTQRKGRSNLWQIQLNGSSLPRQIAATTGVQTNPQFSPDGRRLSFCSTRSGRFENWISDADGRNLRQVTSLGAQGGIVGKARWSPEGSEIAFAGGPAGTTDIWIADVDRSGERRIASHPAEDVLPSYSRDGRWVYFASNRTGEFQIWKVARSGGEAVQVTRDGGAGAIEDAAGQHIYYLNPRKAGIWRMSTAGGPEAPVVDIKLEWREYSHLWTLADDGVLYYCVRDSSSQERSWELTRFDPATRQRKTVLRLPNGLTALTISPDGDTCAYSRQETESESIMLVENFR